MMEALMLHVGNLARVQLDVHQIDTIPIALHDGPVESVLVEQFGTLEVGTHLYGRVWTSGPQIIVRYYQAQRVGVGQRMPICATARLIGNVYERLPGSKPGLAVIEYPKADVYIVSAFRY